MSMSNFTVAQKVVTRTLLFLLFCYTLACSTPKTTPLVEQKAASSIQLDSLLVLDLSEDMSRLSTQEDEIVLLVYLSQNGVIRDSWQSPLYTFTLRHNKHALSHRFQALQAADRLSFFLIELDEEQFSPDVLERCAAAVKAPHFPHQFDPPRLDSLIGDDDLLGMRSITPQTQVGSQIIRFKGRQLFDAFEYQLHLRAFD